MNKEEKAAYDKIYRQKNKERLYEQRLKRMDLAKERDNHSKKMKDDEYRKKRLSYSRKHESKMKYGEF